MILVMMLGVKGILVLSAPVQFVFLMLSLTLSSSSVLKVVARLLPVRDVI